MIQWIFLLRGVTWPCDHSRCFFFLLFCSIILYLGGQLFREEFSKLPRADNMRGEKENRNKRRTTSIYEAHYTASFTEVEEHPDPIPPTSCSCSPTPDFDAKRYKKQLSLPISWLNLTSRQVLKKQHPNFPLDLLTNSHRRWCHLMPLPHM